MKDEREKRLVQAAHRVGKDPVSDAAKKYLRDVLMWAENGERDEG